MKVLHLGVIRTADDVRTHIKNAKGIGENVQKFISLLFPKGVPNFKNFRRNMLLFPIFKIVNYYKT